MAIGSTVQFWDWDDRTGEEVLVTGVVEAEFTEPLSEDSCGRLNYRVRLADGSCMTPYAHECTWRLRLAA